MNAKLPYSRVQNKLKGIKCIINSNRFYSKDYTTNRYRMAYKSKMRKETKHDF